MWCRSHEFASSVQTLVSAEGRLIGLIDEGIIGQPRGVPAFWTLVARNAFNGVLLWRRPCDHINPHALVAVGDRVYVTLRSRGPLCILDAATGRTLHECSWTGKVDQIVWCEGRLVLSTQLAGAHGSGPHVAAVDAENGELIWKQPVKTVANHCLVADRQRVCYFDNLALHCLSLADGRPLWKQELSAGAKGRGYLMIYQGVVLLTGGSTKAFSLESGKLLWSGGPSGSSHARNPPGLFGAGGLIWSAWEGGSPGRSFIWQHRAETRHGYDPLTGQVSKEVSVPRLVTAGHHIRCYPPKATSRYLLLNKRGVEFFDLEGKYHMRANWTRGACGFGMLPANGLLYTPPSQCFCYPGVLLQGLKRRKSCWPPAVLRLPTGPPIGTTRCAAARSTRPCPWSWSRCGRFRSARRPSRLRRAHPKKNRGRCCANTRPEHLRRRWRPTAGCSWSSRMPIACMHWICATAGDCGVSRPTPGWFHGRRPGGFAADNLSRTVYFRMH